MINLVIPTLIMSSIATIIAIAALAMVIGMKLSTHKIEWRPLQVDDPFKESEKEIEAMDLDDSKVLEDALNLQRKGKKAKPADPLDEILETNNF
jgi:hypothetical protein